MVPMMGQGQKELNIKILEEKEYNKIVNVKK